MSNGKKLKYNKNYKYHEGILISKADAEVYTVCEVRKNRGCNNCMYHDNRCIEVREKFSINKPRELKPVDIIGNITLLY